MSGAAAWVRGLFVETRPSVAAVARPTVPAVAVLCTAVRGRAAASGIALALSRAVGSSLGLAGAVGVAGVGGSLGCTPGAARSAARLRERGLAAGAAGRLVWLADRPEATALGDVRDVAALAAASSADLGRAASAAAAPAVLAIPFARSAALDRVLAWFDGIVVVREPGVVEEMLDRALASLGALGRPVVAMAPPPRLAAAIAAGGLRAPSEAMRAVAELGIVPGSDAETS